MSHMKASIYKGFPIGYIGKGKARHATSRKIAWWIRSPAVRPQRLVLQLEPFQFLLLLRIFQSIFHLALSGFPGARSTWIFFNVILRKIH